MFTQLQITAHRNNDTTSEFLSKACVCDFCCVACSYLGCEGQTTPRRISPESVHVLVAASEVEAAQENNKVGPLK